MVDTVCSRRETIRIAGDDYPAEVVKSRFLKLNSSHIEYVLDRMRENTTYVRNIKKYLLAALYNAPATIDSDYCLLYTSQPARNAGFLQIGAGQIGQWAKQQHKQRADVYKRQEENASVKPWLKCRNFSEASRPGARRTAWQSLSQRYTNSR